MRIKLDSGKEIKVENFVFGYTYGGLLCGLPNKKMNDSIFKKITYPSNWGRRKTLKINEKTLKSSEKRLNQWKNVEIHEKLLK